MTTQPRQQPRWRSRRKYSQARARSRSRVCFIAVNAREKWYEKSKSDKETTGEKVMYKRDCRLDLSRKYSYIDDKMYISVSHAPINKTFIIDLIRYLTPTGFGAKSTYNRGDCSHSLSICLALSFSTILDAPYGEKPGEGKPHCESIMNDQHSPH